MACVVIGFGTHVLCTLDYLKFMEHLKKPVNPLTNFIHHSLVLSLDHESKKNESREANKEAYEQILNKECKWFSSNFQIGKES